MKEMWTTFQLGSVSSEDLSQSKVNSIGILSTNLFLKQYNIPEDVIVVNYDGVSSNGIKNIQITGTTSSFFQLTHLIVVFPIPINHWMFKMAKNVYYFIEDEFNVDTGFKNITILKGNINEEIKKLRDGMYNE